MPIRSFNIVKNRGRKMRNQSKRIEELKTILIGLSDALINDQHFKLRKSMSMNEQMNYVGVKDILPRSLNNLIQSLDQISDIKVRLSCYEELFQLFNASTMLGYFLKPLPFVAKENTSALGAKGGEKSGAIRAQRAATTWQVTALELAEKSRLVDPSYSQEKVAYFIAENWKDKKNKCPGHARLKQVISNWIKERKLAEKIR